MFLAFLSPCQPLAAQVVGPSTGGVVALRQALVHLGHHQRVLLIGAHPDDEDTELLSLLARGYGAEAAYLALNRGEGGQNLIGAELGERLGLLRTGELLAARRLDGARQFFTRAYDFGYSKTLDDTWAHWPRDSVLKDVIRVVRQFRPQVIVSIFSGTPRDGHGQHQAAGWAAREAFRLAGDASMFPELASDEGLVPWEPRKLYRSTRFDRSATSLRLQGGVLDPVTGQSFHQIAMRSRSLHRSQDMGVLQRTGPSAIYLQALENRTPSDTNQLFAGLDTTLSGLAVVTGAGPETVAVWRGLERDLQQAVSDPEHLLRLRRRFMAAWPLAPSGVRVAEPALEDQLGHLNRALEAASGIVCDARSLEPVAIPGTEWTVLLSCWNATTGPIRVRSLLQVDDRPSPLSLPPMQLPPGAEHVDTVRIQLSDTLPISTPYFLVFDREAHGGFYVWPSASKTVFGKPLSPPLAAARFEVDSGPVIQRPVVYRTNDQAIGEIRVPVPVVPTVSVALDPGVVMLSTEGADAATVVRVTVQSWVTDTVEGRVGLDLPVGWPRVESQRFRMLHRGERQTFAFTVTPKRGTGPGSHRIRAVVDGPGRVRYDRTVHQVAYPHITATWFTSLAASQLILADVTLPTERRVAYVRGAADRIPESLEGLGMRVSVLEGATLEQMDLRTFDAIVIGPRAYETDSVLVANNGRLLTYVREGGTLVVQYQQYGYFRGNFAPLPMTVASPHDRVTDEGAAVEALRPEHPLLRGPNRITPGDWAGWIQERGLYFPHTWDSAYTPILRMADPGEEPLDGAVLAATVGKGTFVYTGLSFFRQLPAGVPGAVRLFMNLLALESSRAVP